MLKLGQEARDKITGFKGILTARQQYITGCDQYQICPQVKKGELQEMFSFDEDRIEIIGPGINEEEVQGKSKGGPQRQSKSYK